MLNSNDLIMIFLYLQENEGATLIVSARFSCVSARNIYLKFEEVIFLITTQVYYLSWLFMAVSSSFSLKYST